MDGSMDGNTHHDTTAAALENTHFWLLCRVIWGCDDGVGVALVPWQCIHTWAQTPMMDMEGLPDTMDGSMDGNTHHNATVADLETTQNFAFMAALWGPIGL